MAPTKLITIPRLELSAVSSVCNGKVIKRGLEIKNLQEYHWTYSKVVLVTGTMKQRGFTHLLLNRFSLESLTLTLNSGDMSALKIT